MVTGGKIGFAAADGSTGASRRSKKGHVTDDFDPSQYLLLSNIGLQGGVLFSSQEDYDRFEAYLYLLNAVDGPRASNFFLDGRSHDIFTAARGGQLVAIGAYSFTAKQFFILVKQISPSGIAKFMQKLQTAYTMYFNIKYQRDGRIFHSGYRSEIAQSERHFKYLFAYTQLHPAVLFDTNWEDALRPQIVDDAAVRLLAHRVVQYRYSSLGEYSRKKFSILSPKYFPKYCSALKSPDALVKLWKEGVRFSNHVQN